MQKIKQNLNLTGSGELLVAVAKHRIESL